MVLPLLGALAGAGGSIASALIGADATDTANQYNWMANMYNLRQREKERRETRDFANELRAEQKLGGTDALGNRSFFKEGVGWVTELSPEQQELYDFFFNQELPERQSQFQRSAERSREDDDVAGSLLDEFRRVTKASPKEIESLLYEVASRGIGEGARETTEAAMRDAVRTGNSNIGNIMSKIGRSTMDARRDARTDAHVQARDYADDKFNSQRGGLAQLYSMFARQAGAPLGSSFDPSGIPQQANSLMNVFSNQAQQGNSQGFNAASMRGGTLNDIQPNLAYANAAGAIGSSLSGLGDRIGSHNNMQEQNALLKQYLTAGGQISLDSGGMFGKMTDRVRAGGGII